MLTNLEIGERLRALRGSKSLREVSEATGIKLTTLSMYEKGNRRPSDKAKTILADYYKEEVSTLFFTQKCHEM